MVSSIVRNRKSTRRLLPFLLAAALHASPLTDALNQPFSGPIFPPSARESRLLWEQNLCRFNTLAHYNGLPGGFNGCPTDAPPPKVDLGDAPRWTEPYQFPAQTTVPEPDMFWPVILVGLLALGWQILRRRRP